LAHHQIVGALKMIIYTLEKFDVTDQTLKQVATAQSVATLKRKAVDTSCIYRISQADHHPNGKLSSIGTIYKKLPNKNWRFLGA
jgi:hypothetical protein